MSVEKKQHFIYKYFNLLCLESSIKFVRLSPFQFSYTTKKKKTKNEMKKVEFKKY